MDGLDVKRAIPIKIFCLKAEKVQSNINFNEEKPTLAYLSSIIQTQSNQQSNFTPLKQIVKINKNQLNNLSQVKHGFNNSDKDIKMNVTMRKSERIPKTVRTNFRNTSIEQEDKSLSELIGTQWKTHRNIQSFIHTSKKHENQYKLNSNRWMLKKDFELFLKNQSKKQMRKKNPEEKQKKSIINISQITNTDKSVDLIKQQKTYRFNSSNKETKDINQQKKARTFNISSVITRMNFKPVDNFQWSKLNHNIQFNLSSIQNNKN